MPALGLPGRDFHDREDFYTAEHRKVFVIMGDERPVRDWEHAGLRHDRMNHDKQRI
jgi:hypothetical protein